MTTPLSPPRRRAAGLSLIEAMVALVLMAFGTLAVLALQSTLRMNADVARQRGEAVRIAQEALEAARGFTALADYAALAASGPAPAMAPGASNTTYAVTRAVVDTAAGDAAHPRRKSVVVNVDWTDRAGHAQSVRLATVIAGVSPALAGSLAIPSDRALTRQSAQRHLAVPSGAVPWSSGTSRFDPPGGGGIGWVFDDRSGAIRQRCTGAGAETCMPFDARLLSGHVRFATTLALPPTGVDGERPSGGALPVDVQVLQTAPVGGTVDCLEQVLDTSTLAYWCAVPVGAAPAWSGRSLVIGLSLAADVATDNRPSQVRVCRYTPAREHRSVPTQMRNDEHPLDYVAVTGALVQQNFLVVRAGDGVDPTPYTCPPDGPSAFVNTNTWHHQPPG
ncbi:MAG: prepilin-type N-terminal cleavage/methylation domain-containing protein [Rubrivivax sp.]